MGNQDVDKAVTVGKEGESPDKDRDGDSQYTLWGNLETFNEEIYIDLEDPDVDKVALEIQSSFRGHEGRTEVSKSYQPT